MVTPFRSIETAAIDCKAIRAWGVQTLLKWELIRENGPSNYIDENKKYTNDSENNELLHPLLKSRLCHAAAPFLLRETNLINLQQSLNSQFTLNMVRLRKWDLKIYNFSN